MNLKRVCIQIPICSDEEYDKIESYIRNISWNDLFFNPSTREGCFYVPEDFNLNSLKLPAPAKLL